MQQSRIRVDKAVLSRVKPSGRTSDAGFNFHNDLKIAINRENIKGIETHLEVARTLMDSNRFKGKDFALLINSISKLKDSEAIKPELMQDIITRLEFKVTNNPAFIFSLSPVDTSQLMNGLVKINPTLDQESQKLTARIMERITEQIPTKLPLFQDHHLAIVMHALAASETRAFHVVTEIVNEIENSRDLLTFTPQGVVMLANALSRIKLKKTTTVVSLWHSIMKRAINFKEPEMQPNWPDVLLTAVSFSGIKERDIPPEFITSMVDKAEKAFRKGLLERGRYMKCLSTAKGLGLTLVDSEYMKT
jgi:hypothetical protein